VVIFPTVDDLKTKPRMKPTVHELAMDTTASVRGIPNSEFQTPKQLGALLAATPNCQRCVVKQLFRYAMGRPETEADQPAIDVSLKAFSESGFHFQNLIISIVESKVFLGGPVE
jgi:Protein of unknown function (DUF1585)